MKKDAKGYLICESTGIHEAPTIQGRTKSGNIIIHATIQDGDVLNRNKRIYPTEVLKNALESSYVKERLKTKSWYGEAGHPCKPDVQRQLYIDQSNISHIITKIWWEGNKLKAEIEAANTARGKDFQGLIEQGSIVGFSLRAMGPIVENKGDHVIVKDPLTIFTYDWVIHPSHASAYMDKIVSESGNVMMSESADMFEPIYDQTSMDYIKKEGTKLTIGDNQMMISEDCKSIMTSRNKVKVEDALSFEVSKFLRNL